jgi:O-6-methylguanine DNA methyltransferase
MNEISNRSTGYLRRAPGRVSELLVETAAMPVHKQPNQITYAIADSSAGRLVIATTRRGLCWIGMHDSVEYLESELRKDHPQAEVSRDDAQTCELARMIVAEITNDSSALELPLDIRATPFQLAVWRELCAIPRGATRSYGEIARRLGRPDASRAVGHANGSNPLAVIIPCHRAIGSNGALTGYRWGLEYKRRLLEHERALVQMTLGSGSELRG